MKSIRFALFFTFLPALAFLGMSYLLNIGAPLAISKAPDTAPLLGRLIQWDAGWYQNIVRFGYVAGGAGEALGLPKTNIAFFPGFPLLGMAMRALTHGTPAVGIILAAWLAAFFFWWILAQIFGEERWRWAPWIALYPGAMYLVLPYTESLFMLGLVGMLWAVRKSESSVIWAWAAVGMGSVMTATRLVGVAFLVFPILFAATQSKPRWVRGGAMACGGLLGFLGFIAYCHFQFGDAGIYFKTVPLYWGAHGSSWRVFLPTSWFEWLRSAGFPDKLGTVISGSLAVGVPLWIRALWRTDRKFTVPLAYVGTAAAGLALLLWARAPFDLIGMLRYLLAVWIVLVVGAHSMGADKIRRIVGANIWDWGVRLAPGVGVVAFLLQTHFGLRFLLGIAVS